MLIYFLCSFSKMSNFKQSLGVVDNLMDFWFMNCPEYKTKTDDSLQVKTMHAFENHQLNFVLSETMRK